MSIVTPVDTAIHDLAIHNWMGNLFGACYFLSSLPKIVHAYRLNQLRLELSNIPSSSLRERCIQIIPLVSYGTRKELFDLIGNILIDREASIERVKKLLRKEMIHCLLDFAVGLMGGLLFAIYFISKTAFLTTFSGVATALFWGIWAISEISKLHAAFKEGDPSRWLQLCKFVAAFVIFGAIAASQMLLPVGLVSLLLTVALGGFYLYSQYKCKQAIDGAISASVRSPLNTACGGG